MDQDTDIERCRREIEVIEGLIRSGHPDLAGLCLALSDWSAELRIIQAEIREKKPAAADAGRAERGRECYLPSE
jgi:hypothetical protein